MSVVNAIATLGIVLTFAAFIVSLAYAERQTRSTPTGLQGRKH